MSEPVRSILEVARPRHPRKDLEAVLRAAEDRGWRVTKGKGYYGLWCPCPARHKRWVALTPSGSGYLTNLVSWLERQPCWKER